MFAEYAPRLLRMKWSHLGLSHLAGKQNPSNEDVMKAVQGLGTALDQFVEELSTMLTKPVDLYQRAELIVNDSGEVDDNGDTLVPDVSLTTLANIDPSNYGENVHSAFTSIAEHSMYNPDTEMVEGGLAGDFIGAVNFTDIIIGGTMVINGIPIAPGDATDVTVVTGSSGVDSSGHLILTRETITVLKTVPAADLLIDICHTCPEPCTNCEENTTPSSVTITLGGTIVGDPNCAGGPGDCNCSQANCNLILGAYILTQSDASPCLYEYDGTACGFDFRITYQLNATEITGTIDINSVPEVSWTLTGLSAGYDCRTARNLGAASEGTLDACDWTNVTFNKAANPT